MVASLAKRCVEVKGILQDLQSTTGKDSAPITTEDVGDLLDRFLLWAGNLGALRSPSSKLSLDHRLAEAPEVRQQILQQFGDIEEAADDLKAIILQTRPNRRMSFDDSSLIEGDGDEGQASASDTGSDSDDEAHMTLEIISESIKTLFRIAILVRKSTPGDRFTKALQLSKASFPDTFDIDYVKHKHPKLEEAGGSAPADRLGGAIAKRRQVIKYGRDHRARLARDEHQEEELAPEVGASTLAKQLIRASDRASAPAPTEMVSSKATTFHLQAEAIPELLSLGHHLDEEDEEDDVSVMTASTTTDTLAALKLPRLDDLSTDGAPFECPLCFVMQSFTKERAWKAHAFQDLKAYLCTVGDDNCDDMVFGDRTAWFDHEMQHHRSLFVCPLCDEAPMASREALRSHLDEHHGSFSIEQVTRLEAAGQRAPQVFKPQDCPFCDDWAEALRRKHATLRQPELAFEYTVTADRFKRHVAMHQEQLAIFAIPRAEGGDGTPDSGSVAGSLSSRAGFDSEAEWGSEPSNHTPAGADEISGMDRLHLTSNDDGVHETRETQEQLPDIHSSDTTSRRPRGVAEADHGDDGGDEQGDALFGKYIITSPDKVPSWTLESMNSARDLCLRCDLNPYAVIDEKNGRIMATFSTNVGMTSTKAHLRNEGYEIGPWQESMETARDWLWNPDEVSRVLVLACAAGQQAYFLYIWEQYAGMTEDLNIDTVNWQGNTLLESAAPGMRPLLAQMGCSPKPPLPQAGSLLTYAADHNEGLLVSLMELGAPVDRPGLGWSTPLEIAAGAGQLRAVSLLVDAGADVNKPSIFGDTPLHLAASKGHVDVVRLLIEYGADVNKGGIAGNSPLHVAATPDVVSQLVSSGADINSRNVSKRTPLFNAAERNHLLIMEALLEEGADPLADDGTGAIPLSAACRTASLNTARRLIPYGGINFRDHDGRTPLWYVVNSGHADIVRMLRQNGADPNIPDRKGVFPLGVAVAQLRSTIVDDLLGDSSEVAMESAFFSCLFDGRPEGMRIMLQSGFSPNRKYGPANTALYLAVNRKDIESVRLLLEYGANIGSRNAKGRTALAEAAAVGSAELVRLLLDKGANPQIEDYANRTPLFDAAEGGHVRVIHMLLEAGCDPLVVDKLGMTALGTAARERHVSASEQLLEAVVGASASPKPTARGIKWLEALCQAIVGGSMDIVRMFAQIPAFNIRGQLPNGMSPLMHAVLKEDAAIVKALLQWGCSPNMPNNEGETPLFYAAAAGHEAITRLLLDAGADASHKDNSGGTAIDIARRHGHNTVVEVLSQGPESSEVSAALVEESQGHRLEYAFRCFFNVRDPAHTARLVATHHSSCVALFPSVKLLHEHLVRAHSLTYNCAGCRGMITNADEVPAFRARHADCQKNSIRPPPLGPMPVLLDKIQTAALDELDMRSTKPKDEMIRCQKLWTALFPSEPFKIATIDAIPAVEEAISDADDQKVVRSPQTPADFVHEVDEQPIADSGSIAPPEPGITEDQPEEDAGRLCAADGCAYSRLSQFQWDGKSLSSEHCAQHTCFNASSDGRFCTTPSLIGAQHCLQHSTCIAPGCKQRPFGQPKDPRGFTCQLHQCPKEGCYSIKNPVHDACERHKCAQFGCSRVADKWVLCRAHASAVERSNKADTGVPDRQQPCRERSCLRFTERQDGYCPQHGDRADDMGATTQWSESWDLAYEGYTDDDEDQGITDDFFEVKRIKTRDSPVLLFWTERKWWRFVRTGLGRAPRMEVWGHKDDALAPWKESAGEKEGDFVFDDVVRIGYNVATRTAAIHLHEQARQRVLMVEFSRERTCKRFVTLCRIRGIRVGFYNRTLLDSFWDHADAMLEEENPTARVWR